MSNLVEVVNLRKYFPIKTGIFSRSPKYVRAVDDVSFSIKRGEMFGLVGESGCGKTTIARCIIRFIEPTSGLIRWNGHEIEKINKEMRLKMQMIFQDPHSSLDPTMSVEEIISEALTAYGIKERDEKVEETIKLLKRLELDPSFMYRYPHELSGGEKQRIGIARALSVKPEFVIADEPVAALDASVKAKILNIMMDLREDLGFTTLFISHDLSVVKHVVNRFGVMYAGKLVELGPVGRLYGNPQHPYTEGLLSAIPVPNPALRRKRILLKGDVPNLIDPPPGCRFRPRCRYATEVCGKKEPEPTEIEKEHLVACHLRL